MNNGRGVADLLTETARLLPPRSPAVEGQEAVARAIQGVIDMGARRIRLQAEEIEGSGKRAYEIGTYNLFGEDDQLIDEGKYTVVWQRENGVWKLHWDLWNGSLLLGDTPSEEPDSQPGIFVLTQNVCPGENMDAVEIMSDGLSARILDELVDEGKLVGWGEFIHGWGNERNHNVYFVIEDHRAFVDFWEIFVTRLSQRDPEWVEKFEFLCPTPNDHMYTVLRMRSDG